MSMAWGRCASAHSQGTGQAAAWQEWPQLFATPSLRQGILYSLERERLRPAPCCPSTTSAVSNCRFSFCRHAASHERQHEAGCLSSAPLDLKRKHPSRGQRPIPYRLHAAPCVVMGRDGSD